MERLWCLRWLIGSRIDGGVTQLSLYLKELLAHIVERLHMAKRPGTLATSAASAGVTLIWKPEDL